MNLLSRLFGGGADAPSAEPIEAHRRQAAGALVIDVREPEEWAAGHVTGAVHLPMGQVPARLSEIPRDREVLLICRSGNRSGQVQRLLRTQGYANAINVAGGTTAWSRAGLPLTR